MTAAVRLEVLRPVTRGDCVDGPRPCPWTSCRHHLLVEDELVGRDRLERSPSWAPGLRVHPAARSARTLGEALDTLPESCALDIADAAPDGMGLRGVGALLGISGEAVRLIELRAVRKVRAAEKAP